MGGTPVFVSRYKGVVLPATRPLDRSCATCEHFDGDAHCALPADKTKPFHGFIALPLNVVCDQHVFSEGE